MALAASILDRLAASLASSHAARMTRGFRAALDQASATQDRLLAKLLRFAEPTEFGREHHFAKIRNYRDFTGNVPIRPYAEVAGYLDRVREGRTNALFPAGTPIHMFALTSGTTATPKYIPITPQALRDCRAGWNIWGLAALLDHPQCILRHIVQVTSPMDDHRSAAGVPCGAITGLLAATQKRLVRRYYTSPLAIAAIRDSRAKYYAIMRMAIPKDVAWMVTANPATLLALARIGHEARDRIIRDIHDGTLDEALEIDAPVRSALRPVLKPDPLCARRLEKIVQSTGTLYPKDYWRLGFIAHWTGGTMGLYRSLFPKYFGDVPVRDIGLIASEGRMSIPMEDDTAGGVLAVSSQFFEFIPAAEYGGDRPTALRCHELSEGQDYFVVLTNASGLFRYDLGDRVRVTGRRAPAPVIEFLSRDAHTSSMAGEKLTEDQVVLAMREACAGRTTIIDFVVAPQWAERPWYRVYVERGAGDFAERFDAALCRISLEYESKRQSLRLGPVELVELPAGALSDRDRRLRAQRERTAEQFKHQYLLAAPGRDADLAKLMRPLKSASA